MRNELFNEVDKGFSIPGSFSFPGTGIDFNIPGNGIFQHKTVHTKYHCVIKRIQFDLIVETAPFMVFQSYFNCYDSIIS